MIEIVLILMGLTLIVTHRDLKKAEKDVKTLAESLIKAYGFLDVNSHAWQAQKELNDQLLGADRDILKALKSIESHMREALNEHAGDTRETSEWSN